MRVPEFIEDAQALGARHQRLTELLESLPARLSTPAVNWRVLESQAYQMLDQWRALLADDVADARRVLRELLDGPFGRCDWHARWGSTSTDFGETTTLFNGGDRVQTMAWAGVVMKR